MKKDTRYSSTVQNTEYVSVQQLMLVGKKKKQTAVNVGTVVLL